MSTQIPSFRSNLEQYKKAAKAIVKIWKSGEPADIYLEGSKVTVTREQIGQRYAKLHGLPESALETAKFNLSDAQFLIARSCGFESWPKFAKYIEEPKPEEGEPTFENAAAVLDKGSFSRLESMLGGPAGFDRQIVEWYKNGNFDGEPEILAEALTCACMLGRTETARYLLDKGVDPYSGMKTWLAGPHYAVSSGRLETVKMLIEKKVPLEIENLYGGNMLGQAFWSAVNEHKSSHAEIIEALIEAGAEIEPGTLEWWNEQSVPSPETKQRVAEALRKAEEK